MGSPGGGSEKLLGVTTTAHECENLVREKEPTAQGASWGDPILMGTNDNEAGQCWAVFGNIHIVTSSRWRGCIFTGIIL